MLVEFKVKNFRSFNDVQSFSMESLGKNEFYKETGFKKFPYLTHIAGFYGANGSGKSNIFRALDVMQKFVVLGFKRYSPNEPIKTDSFCLSADTIHAPTEFAIKFIHKNKLYDYEFHYNQERVLFEKLIYLQYDGDKTQRQKTILERTYDADSKNNYKYNNGLKTVWSANTRENVLALSTAAFLGDKDAQEAYDWFDDILKILLDDNKIHKSYTIRKLDTHKNNIQSLMQQADVGIIDYSIIDKPIDENRFEFPEDFPKELKNKILYSEGKDKDIVFTHQSTDENHNQISFKQQSQGTQVFFGLSGILLEVLEKGEILCIDEIDENLHPDLLIEIIQLFQNPAINIKNAQLIFSAHNTYLMNNLTQEQIWFTQKDKSGATEIYSLLDYKVKKNDDFIAHYHRGVYGAVPHIMGLIDEK